MSASPLGLFEGYGIEIEAAVVARDTLDVRPVVDELLRFANAKGEWAEDFDDGSIGWSNELVSHVVEMKTNGPVPSFEGVAAEFRRSGARLDALLRGRLDARRLPTAMHPWMDPTRETRIWPHHNAAVYSAYDRLFDCSRHGWSNLQSVHLNLPFADEAQFGALMAAVRVALPLIPALAASSPVLEGRATGKLDSRLGHYWTNSRRARAMTGDVIPEPVFTYEAYRREVLEPIDVELKELGADEALVGQDFTNARGAIARFDRMAIEIRLIDAQECTSHDLAVAAAVASVVRRLVEERWSPSGAQRGLRSASLVALAQRAIELGPQAAIEEDGFAELFGSTRERAPTLGALWRELLEPSWDGPAELEQPARTILSRGTLAERVLAALGESFGRQELRSVYAELADCCEADRTFRP